jgi:hypothetical protein
MIDESHLLSEFPPGLDMDGSGHTDESLYACSIGQSLWETYRLTNIQAPVRPPEAQEQWPDPEARAYFRHASRCPDCSEV